MGEFLPDLVIEGNKAKSNDYKFMVQATPERPATLLGLVIRRKSGNPSDDIFVNVILDAEPLFLNPVPLKCFAPTPLLPIERQVSAVNEIRIVAEVRPPSQDPMTLKVYPILRSYRPQDPKPAYGRRKRAVHGAREGEAPRRRAGQAKAATRAQAPGGLPTDAPDRVPRVDARR